MKATGVIRNLDNLGRFVIPKELRDTYGLSENSKLEVFIDEDSNIILKKYAPVCMVCNESDDLAPLDAENSESKFRICKKCYDKIGERFKN